MLLEGEIDNLPAEESRGFKQWIAHNAHLHPQVQNGYELRAIWEKQR